MLRCLEIVNGIELITMDGSSKQMNVKADAKTRERLDAHEASREKTSVSFGRDYDTSDQAKQAK